MCGLRVFRKLKTFLVFLRFFTGPSQKAHRNFRRPWNHKDRKQEGTALIQSLTRNLPPTRSAKNPTDVSSPLSSCFPRRQNSPRCSSRSPGGKHLKALCFYNFASRSYKNGRVGRPGPRPQNPAHPLTERADDRRLFFILFCGSKREEPPFRRRAGVPQRKNRSE